MSHESPLGTVLAFPGRAASAAWILSVGLSGGIISTASEAAPDLRVSRLELTSQRRVDSQTFEYHYRVVVQNRGTEANDVRVRLLRQPAGTQAVSAFASLPLVRGGAESSSVDEIVIQHDRRYPFTFDQLGFSVSGQDAGFSGRLDAVGTLLAASQTTDLVRPTSVASTRLVDLATGQSVFNNVLRLEIQPGCTVLQVNVALDAVNARIVAMGANSTFLTVEIPPQASYASIEAVRLSLVAMPGIADVWTSTKDSPKALPFNPAYASPLGSDFITNASQYIDHQLAIRGNGLWNLQGRWVAGLYQKGLLEKKLDSEGSLNMPVVVYDDYFGRGKPNSLYSTDSQYTYLSGVSSSDGHGYRVMSVVSADFAGDNLPNSLAAGIFPGQNLGVATLKQIRLPAIAIDNEDPGILDVMPALREAKVVRSGGRNVILQRSLGGLQDCTALGAPANCRAKNGAGILNQHRTAAGIIDFVRGASTVDMEGHTLLVSAAGNETDYWAYEGSSLNLTDVDLYSRPGDVYDPPGRLARLAPDGSVRKDASGLPMYLDKLQNVAVVGAYSKQPTRRQVVLGGRVGAPFATCPTDLTNLYADVSGVGGDDKRLFVCNDSSCSTSTTYNLGVWTLAGPGFAGSFESGTSLAAPQYTGVAAWIWTLRPELTARQLKSLIGTTSMHGEGSPCTKPEGITGVIDAYSAVLATDNPDGSRHLGHVASPLAPVRGWLLDVASVDAAGNIVDVPDGKFTQADIGKFLQEFEKRRGDMTPDYSRFDLNGDGSTGEVAARTSYAYTARFDLDGNMTWDNTYLTVENVNKPTPEFHLADIDVLIYYAYSDLYEGNEYERTMLLLPYMSRTTDAVLFLDRLRLNTTLPRATTFDLTSIDDQKPDVTSLCPEGERGTPIYSAQIKAVAHDRFADVARLSFWLPRLQAGRLAEMAPNSPNCSSLIAAIPGSGLVWINSAARHVDGTTHEDVEYQSRIFLGEPDFAAPRADTWKPSDKRRATQSLRYGTVDTPTGAFVPLFDTGNIALLPMTFKLGLNLQPPPAVARAKAPSR